MESENNTAQKLDIENEISNFIDAITLKIRENEEINNKKTSEENLLQSDLYKEFAEQLQSNSSKQRVIECLNDYMDEYIEEEIDNSTNESKEVQTKVEDNMKRLKGNFMKISKSVEIKDNYTEENDYLLSFSHSFSISNDKYKIKVKLSYDGTDEGDGEHTFYITDCVDISGNFYLGEVKMKNKINKKFKKIYKSFDIDELSPLKFIEMLFDAVNMMSDEYTNFNNPLKSCLDNIKFS